MTDTFDPDGAAPQSLFDMVNTVLSRDLEERYAQHPNRIFGAAGDIQGAAATSSTTPSFDPSPMSRMFSSKFGNEAVSRVGNEEKTLTAINHLSSELLARTLRETGQVAAEDRILLTTSVSPSGGPVPVVVVLSDQDTTDGGILRSDTLSLPHDMTKRMLFSAADSVPRDRLTSPPSASFSVLERALQMDLNTDELMAISQPEVISFKRPEMIDLSAPENSQRVVRGNDTSSTGVLCTLPDGTLGVTACYHGTGDVGVELLINAHPGKVTLANPVQDLVFIALDDLNVLGPRRDVNGLREEDDLAPAQREPFTFDGIRNPHTNTLAQSSDPWLFNTDPHAQIRLQTNRDTDHGDSGSALLDRFDKLCGFAFRMTPYGYNPGFTDWIWAPNALASLNLTLLSE